MTFILCSIIITSVLGLFQVFSIGDFGLPPIEFAFLLVFGYALHHTVWLGRPFRVPRRLETIAMAAVLLVCAASSITPLLSGNSPMVSQGLKTLLHLLYIWLTAWVLIALPITSRQWMTALRVHFVVSFIIVAFAIYQLPARTFEWPLGWIEVTNQSFRKLDKEAAEMGQLALRFADFYRATSVFSEPSALAGYSAMSLMMMLVPLFRRSHTIIKSKAFLFLSIGCTTIALFLSFSMSGLVLVGATLVLSVILYPRTAPKRLAIFLSVTIMTLVASDYAIETYFNISVLTLFSTRVENLVSGKATSQGSDIIGESVTMRTSDYWVSGKVFESAPILGVGNGNFGKSELAKRYFTKYPSTLYGSILGEMGVVGFSIVVFFLFLLYARSQHAERQWTRLRLREDSDLERLLPLIPFRMVLVIVVGTSGSSLISAIFWFDVVIVLSTLGLARQALGIEQVHEVFIVRRAWRDRFLENKKVPKFLGE